MIKGSSHIKAKNAEHLGLRFPISSTQLRGEQHCKYSINNCFSLMQTEIMINE